MSRYTSPTVDCCPTLLARRAITTLLPLPLPLPLPPQSRRVSGAERSKADAFQPTGRKYGARERLEAKCPLTGWTECHRGAVAESEDARMPLPLYCVCARLQSY